MANEHKDNKTIKIEGELAYIQGFLEGTGESIEVMMGNMSWEKIAEGLKAMAIKLENIRKEIHGREDVS